MVPEFFSHIKCMCSILQIIILNTEHWLSQHLSCSQTHLKWQNNGKHIKYKWITFAVTSQVVPPWIFKWFKPNSSYTSDNASLLLGIITFVSYLFCIIYLQQIHELSLHTVFPTTENYWHKWLLKPLPVPFYPSSSTLNSVHVNPTINSNTEKFSTCFVSYKKSVASTF
jgi:hypothetical protein